MYGHQAKYTCSSREYIVVGIYLFSSELIKYYAAHWLQILDKNEIVILGSWVEMGDILASKLTSQMAKKS